MSAGEVEPYIMHRLHLAGWQGRPALDPEAFLEIYRHTGGVPRRVNQLAQRILLFGAVERLDLIDADAIAAVAADMSEDARRPQEERVLPLRSVAAGTATFGSNGDARRDEALEQRVVELEARIAEQEETLRRVLTLLVDWVESDVEPVSYRHNAA
jgi:hypothetical protein